MTKLPDNIDGLGRLDERWRQNPEFDPGTHRFDTNSYFIWSRFDGHTTTRDIILMVGLPLEQIIGVLRELYAVGAVLRPGENPASVAARMAEEARARAAAEPGQEPGGEPASPDEPARERERWARADTEPADIIAMAEQDAREAAGASVSDDLTIEESTAMALALDIPDKIKLRVLHMRRKLATADYFALFDLDRESIDKRSLKRSYFRLSKEFHPDRYYGKKTGPFGPWLAEIFQAVTEGFQLLSDERERARYLATLDEGSERAAPTQTKEEYAAELFERAKNAEIEGQLDKALELFSAATRLVPESRYLIRAAHCALAAEAFEDARAYAHKALERDRDNPSVLRILAESYHLVGEHEEAERILLEALAKKSENDKLAAELRRDLEAVRAARS